MHWNAAPHSRNDEVLRCLSAETMKGHNRLADAGLVGLLTCLLQSTHGQGCPSRHVQIGRPEALTVPQAARM